MGCDIHGWVEVNDDGKWIAVKELKDRDRNYRRFALLAGVRDYHNESSATPKGIPADVSETAAYSIKEWNGDGHSHSYLPITEAAKIFLETAYNPREYAQQYPVSEYFDFEDDTKEARLVFWFDN